MDTRLRAATEVIQVGDTPNSGGTAVTIGVGRSGAKRLVSFPAPSVPGMLLKVARDSSGRANELLDALTWEPAPIPALGLETEGITPDSYSHLFDFYQEALVCITSSYQAVEAFCNLEIEYLMGETDTYPREVKRRGGGYEIQVLSRDELEKTVPTVEKVNKVLPALLKLPRLSEVDNTLWSRFQNLRVTRDKVIHCRSRDQYFRSADPEDYKRASTLFSELIDSDIRRFALVAVEVIDYFDSSDRRWPWLQPELEAWGLVAGRE